MASQNELRVLLSGGDRRSVGNSNKVVSLAYRDPTILPFLVNLLEDKNILVRMRAADALEKVTQKNRDALNPSKPQLLRIAKESKDQEVKWHLAQMLPGLTLSPEESKIVFKLMEQYLKDKSSIVRTCALQAMVELYLRRGIYRERAQLALKDAFKNGTPAMKARARKLSLLIKNV
ncbi:MAG TPA: HEAT repeat domain-containing protein [Nitrospiria bacterium]|nr:HEAT repeat domain-containing protein [Nitrospiria bacterium]